MISLAVAAAPAVAGSARHLGFVHGSLRIERSDAEPIFSLAGLAIGEERSASIKITNAGSLAGLYRLAIQADGTEPLLRQLHLTVASSGSRGSETLYAGKLSLLHRLELGRFASGEVRTFRFRVTLRSTGSNAADNALQGLAARASFTWAASQTP